MSLTVNLIYSQENNNMETIEKIITEVKNKFAPDKRTAIFNIHIENTGNKVLLTGETTEQNALNELTDKMKNLNNIELNVKLLPEEKLGAKHLGIINLSVGNIRSKPSHPAELATQTLLGTCVNVFKENDDWYLIQTPDKYIAWLDNDALVLVDEQEQLDWKQSKKIIYSKPYGQVYKEADNKSERVSDIVIGDILKYIKDENGFVNVEFPDGRSGFVEKENCSDYTRWVNDSLLTGETIVKTAKEYLGLPYLWGGTSAKGFDCSGFTKTVYFINGVILPRDASQQVLVGELVDTSTDFNKLQPGDLLFFGRKKSETEKERVTHVAIYIGEGKYIHAAGRVKINSLEKESNDFSEYRFNTFIRAKRYIGSYNKGKNLVKNNPYYK
jgi:cell wall-associated NlpC family hydrolase